MRNYFKKFSIMFAVMLIFIGIGIIQNGSNANAAVKIGNQLTQAENGWNRNDDTDSKILIENGYRQDNNGGNVGLQKTTSYYKETRIFLNPSGKIRFYYFGNDFRVISDECHPARTNKIKVTIDGREETVSLMDNNTGDIVAQVLQYQSNNLSLDNHTIIIENLDSTKPFMLDAIDLNSNGYLISPTVDINESSISLLIGDTYSLTATTTPSSIGVTWTSSDPSIATIDSGKVNGVKEGTCTITATTADGSGIVATCTVTVTKKDDPQPTDSNGDANLLIELVDGQIKQYTVSQDEINKFTSWFENRDKDHSLTATYKFTKGTYKDYVVHDQIDWFEVR